MFSYQDKINEKDAVIIVGESVDAGKQIPVQNGSVYAIYEDEDGKLVGAAGEYKDGEFEPSDPPTPGPSIEVIELNVTENNTTYTAPTGKAYSPVNVDIPSSTVLIDYDISENGTYYADECGGDGFRSVDVDVPNTYEAGDVGNVVQEIAPDDYGLVPQDTEVGIYENGVHDTTYYSSVNVQVSNSYDWSEAGMVVKEIPELDRYDLVSQESRPETITENGSYDTTYYDSVYVEVEGGAYFVPIINGADWSELDDTAISEIMAGLQDAVESSQALLLQFSYSLDGGSTWENTGFYANPSHLDLGSIYQSFYFYVAGGGVITDNSGGTFTDSYVALEFSDVAGTKAATLRSALMGGQELKNVITIGDISIYRLDGNPFGD